MTRGQQAAKGLTTVALLKVYFDQGHDHIDMFLPFALDVIRIRATDDFHLNDIKTDLLSRHGLSVPVNTLQTLLVRAARRKKVRREGGRYFRKPEALEGVDLLSAKVSVEREHAAVAKQFREFASAQGLVLQSDESALGLIVGFLEKNQVGMLLEPDVPGTLLTAETLSRREMSMVARFLQSIFRSDPQNTKYVQRMLEGLVLQSTLLLSDISLANRRFVDLTVFLAEVRTDLDAFSEAEAAVLENHGYLLADAAVRVHLPDLAGSVYPESAVPWPKWMDEAEVRRALADSHERRLLGRR